MKSSRGFVKIILLLLTGVALLSVGYLLLQLKEAGSPNMSATTASSIKTTTQTKDVPAGKLTEITPEDLEDIIYGTYGQGIASNANEFLKVPSVANLCTGLKNPRASHIPNHISPDGNKVAGKIPEGEDGCATGTKILIYDIVSKKEKIIDIIEGDVIGWANNSILLLSNRNNSSYTTWLWSFDYSTGTHKAISSSEVNTTDLYPWEADFNAGNIISPDGKWIVIDNSYLLTRKVWLVSTNGEKQISLTDLPCEYGCHSFTWDDDSRSIYFGNPSGTRFDQNGIQLTGEAQAWKLELAASIFQ